MNISKYTFLFSSQECYYIYNTLSNSLIAIDYYSFKILEEAKSKKKDFIEKLNLDKELLDILIEKRFVVENSKDEYLMYKSIINDLRRSGSSMHLTMVPTMNCNFNCHYCFEEKNTSVMTSEIMDSIIKYVQSYKEIETIKVTWFGGEPLMAIKQIEEFHSKFRTIWKKGYSSDIITTGYLLTPEIANILKKVEISSIQITLDGKKDHHNSIKKDKNCDDVFGKTLKNIDLLLKIIPEINIGFRINLSKENADDFAPLYIELTQRYLGKNITVSPAFILDRSACDSCDSKKKTNSSYFFNRKEKSEFVLNLFKEKGIHSHWLSYPSRFFGECAIRNKEAIGFDPEGYAYKCWEHVGNKKYTTGKLIDGVLTEINWTTLNRQLYGADSLDSEKCKQCSYLPICNGGCPVQRIENEFEGKKNDTCTTYKGYLDEIIGIHLNLKKEGRL